MKKIKIILLAIISPYLCLAFVNENGRTDDSDICACSKEGKVLEMVINVKELFRPDQDKSEFIFKKIKNSRNTNSTETGKNEWIKIDKQTTVNLVLTRANLFRYDFEISEEDFYIESYGVLNEILSTIIELGGGGVSGNTAFETWYNTLNEIKKDYQNIIETQIPATVYLDDIDYGKIEDSLSDIRKKLTKKELHNSIKVAKSFLKSNENSNFYRDLYQELKTSQNNIEKKVQTLFKIFDRIKKGIRKKIKARKAGTIVTISIAPTLNGSILDNNEVKNRIEAASIEYFVESNHKLHFHTGYSFSSLNDVEIEKLTKGSNDVFTIVKNQKNSNDLAAFLSYPILHLDKLGTSSIDLSIGTTFNNIGNKIFLGATIRIFKYGSVTAGTVIDTNHITVEDNLTIGDSLEQFSVKNQVAGFFSINITAF